MAMSSYEIIKAAISNQSPERLPVRMGSLGVDDTFFIGRGEQVRNLPGSIRIDEWGCTWEQTSMKNIGQVRGHPLASVDEFEKALIPDFNESWRYTGLEKEFSRAEAEGKYTQAHIFMILFERMHSLAGFENVLMGLLLDPDNCAALADRIMAAQITLIRNYQERFGKRLHAFNMTEDWGTQQSAFIDMDLWRSFFLPRYRTIFSAMHEGGQDVWVHSCGKVNDVIEGLIEAGADVVNLQQPRALGIMDVGRRYRGKITFESLSDIQATLPSGDAQAIKNDARDLGRYWMAPSGGFVFSDYGDGEAIGAPIKQKLIMYKAFSAISQEIYGKPLPDLPTGIDKTTFQ